MGYRVIAMLDEATVARPEPAARDGSNRDLQVIQRREDLPGPQAKVDYQAAAVARACEA